MGLLDMLSTNEIIAQVLGFLMLLFLLRIFAWKKLLGLLDERKARIASEFKKIDDAKAEVEKLKSDYASKLDEIEEAANLKINEAAAEGKRITEEIRKKAHEEAQDIINSAKKNITYELSKAKEQLKDEIVGLTIKATESIINEKFTGEKDKKLVEDFLDKLDQV